MTSRPLWQWSAEETATAVKGKTVSATEVIEATIKRMEAVNPRLNAVVVNLADAARHEAATIDANKHIDGKLLGVPITIKINTDQAGQATSNGLPHLASLIANDDAPIVRNLKRAGAIIVGRTNTPEFSFRADTDNPLFGRTYNHWSRVISPGGASGGAGAAVMAGIGALAQGNDIGGSLRFPASANGAVTVKPGLGRIPAWNPSQDSSERGILAQAMSVQGLITRCASDLELAMPVAIAPDPRDPFHVPIPWRGSPIPHPIRVAFTKDHFGHGLHPDVSVALDNAVAALADAGYIIEEVEVPLVHECANVGYRCLMGEVRTLLDDDIQTFGSETLKAIFAEYYQYFPPYQGSELIRMMAQRTYFARQWSLFLENYPLVLTPFLLKPFFTAGRDEEGSAGVQDVIAHSLWSFIFNFIGLPAGNLPTHIADLATGPQPIGIQIVGRRWREDLIVDAMTAIESRIPPVCSRLWSQMA